MVEALKEKLELLKSRYDKEIFLDLALLNASVGNSDVAKLYIDEYKKQCSSTDIKVSCDTFNFILDINYHKRWKNYRRERNQNEKKRFAVTASLCRGDVLEIGCANGDLSSYISMYGHRIFGIDIDPVAVELARYKVWHFGLSDCYFNIDDANNLSLPDSAFDTVVLAEILEHVTEPQNVINEARRVCKNDGIIIISVPRGYRIPSPDHIHIFNKDKLMDMLKNSGVDEKYIHWENNVPDEWILCWFSNNKESKSKDEDIPLQDYFIPPHSLERLDCAGMVSIILPTYNGQAYIKEAIDSLLGQTYKNFELIVVDDGSTDKTYEKIKPYMDKGLIKYYYQENNGKPAAINKGIEIARGDYIWIFDDDDTALPKKLEVQMRHFLRNPNVDIIHTSSVYTDASNRCPLLVWEPSQIEQKDLLKNKLYGCLFHGTSVIVKSKCYSKVGKWDERLIRAQDYDMWIRLSRYFESSSILIPTVTYRQHKKVRGSKDKPIPIEEVVSATKEYEKIVMGKVYNDIPLEEIFPEIQKHPENTGLKVSALIERAYAMAKRDLFDYALKDLKEAFDLAVVNYPVNLTQRGIFFIKKLSNMKKNIFSQDIRNIINYFILLINIEIKSNEKNRKYVINDKIDSFNNAKKINEKKPLWPIIISTSVENINNKVKLFDNETSNFVRLTTMIIDGRYNDALEELGKINKCLFEKYQDVCNYIYSIIYLKIGNISKAFEYIKKVEKLDNDRCNLLFGDILLLQGDYYKANKRYEKISDVKLRKIRLFLCKLVSKGDISLKNHDDLVSKCVDIFKKNKYKLNVTYLPIVNGVTGGMKIIYEQINRLYSRGHKVEAISYYGNPNWFDLQVKVKKVNINDDISKYIKNTDAIVYTFWNQWYEINNFDNTIFLIQGDEFLFDDTKLNPVVKEAVKNSHVYSESKFLAVSEFLNKTIEKKFGRSCVAIKNAIDTEVFNSSSAIKNKEKSKVRIIIVGNAKLKFKGFEDIIKAFDIVKKKGYEFDVTWITQSKPIKYPDYIDVYENPPQDKIPELYREADIYICGSHYEAFSLPPLEAMASGCAVITTKNGGISDYAKDGYNCLMSEVGDYNSLAENIIKLIQDKELRKSIVKNGFKTVKNYTWDKAIDKLEEVLIYQYLDIKPVKSKYLKSNTLSLCIITKDEEKNIARCINSVKDVVDEIVVVDTGSKDKTVEIAESLGARVIHTKWEDDFSKARNTAIENAKSDWILFLDADEVVKREDVGKIRPLLEDDTVEAYMFKFVNYGGGSISTGRTTIHYNFKLFRNNGKLRYVYPIHENLKNVADNRSPIYKESGITILHYGYLNETRIEKNKTQRYINMLSEYLLTHPNDLFQHLNLGVEYFNAKEYDKALKHLQIVQKRIKTNSPLSVRLYIYLIQTYAEMKDYDTALKIVSSVKSAYEKIPDFHFLEGAIYFKQKRYQKAVETFNRCFSIGDCEGRANFIGGAGSYRAKYMIAHCREMQGDLNGAVKDYIKLLIARPGFKEVFIKLFDIFVKNERPEAVREFFDKYVDKKDPENYAILARLYMNIGKHEIAKRYLDDVKIDVQGLNNLKGMVYMGLKKYQDALKSFDMEYGRAKNTANYYKALCHIILKDFNQAKDAVWKLENSGDKKLFLTIIGELKAKFDEVKDDFFQLLEFLLTVDEFELFNNLLNIYANDFSRDDYVRYGKLMEKKGFEELALNAYITAADRNCQDAHVYRYLAQKALEKDMYDEALAMAGKALNLDSRDIESFVMIYRLYKTLKRKHETEHIKKIIRNIYPEIDIEELTAKS